MGGFPGMGGIEARVNRPFEEQYRCYSMAMFPGAQREIVDYGGKGKPPSTSVLSLVILPPTALDKLSICPLIVSLRDSATQHFISHVI